MIKLNKKKVFISAFASIHIKYQVLTILLIVGTFLKSNSQSKKENAIYNKDGQNHMGLGFGLSYGGIGGRFAFSTSESFGLMLGAGYNLVGIGYNLGFMTYIPSSSKTQAYLSGMWGTNAAIKIKGLPDSNESYNGVSFGLGAIINSRANPGTYWDLGIIIPIRSSKFKDDWDAVKKNTAIQVQQDVKPILINIGYNIKI